MNEANVFQVSVAAVDINAVPVVSDDRHIGRKVQAALTRKLFRSLDIKKVSVTAPNYSMAQSVDIRLPRDGNYTRDDNGDVRYDCPVATANRNAKSKLNEILAKAFPNHDNRSDSQVDYFDYCWSIQ